MLYLQECTVVAHLSKALPQWRSSVDREPWQQVDSFILGIESSSVVSTVHYFFLFFRSDNFLPFVELTITGRAQKTNSAILVCQADGLWSGSPPVCDAHCDAICFNGGSCKANSRKCSCPPGYSGDRCQHGKVTCCNSLRCFCLFFSLVLCLLQFFLKIRIANKIIDKDKIVFV